MNWIFELFEHLYEISQTDRTSRMSDRASHEETRLPPPSRPVTASSHSPEPAGWPRERARNILDFDL